MGNNESHSEEGIPVKQELTQTTETNAEPLQVVMTGEAENFRVRARQDSSTELSMWHDIKLFPEKDSKKKKIVNMVCEIPKCSRKKYEIATKEPGNPIKQDIKKGKLREFARGDLYFNYGCLPRTWEDPETLHPDAKHRGDNDPLDICEIGLRIMSLAEISPVKILGTLCLIDEGEADWKIIGINVNDPWAELLNDVDDIERLLPGTVSSIREWFRIYKVADGKPENKFALEERCMPAEYAMQVIEETHHSWVKLVSGEEDYPDSSSDGRLSVEGGNPLKKDLAYPKLSSENLAKLIEEGP